MDLQQAKTQYLATLASIPALQITLIKTRNAISTLLGRPPGEIPELARKLDSLPRIDPPAIQEQPAGLVLRRPDVRTAAWRVAAQSAQIGVAEADFYPAVSLLGSIGWSGNTLGASSDTSSLVIGPSVSWNIFDYGRIENNVRVQDVRLQELIEQYQEKVLQAAHEIDAAAISVVKTAEQQKLLDRSVQAARRALDLANTRYREGYADFQRVLDAQRAAFAQDEQRLIGQGNHISAIITLYKALGGGWLVTPIEQLIPARLQDTMRERTDWGNLLSAPLPVEPDRPPLDSEIPQYE